MQIISQSVSIPGGEESRQAYYKGKKLL